jgi:hypothetical protein
MRTRGLAVFVVGLLVGGLMLLSGSSQARDPVTKLRRRVARLENRVADLETLETRVADLESAIYPCLFVQGMSQYGDPAGTYGYLYSDDGVNAFLTTALDLDTGEAPEVWTAVVAPECVAPSVGKGQGLYTPLKTNTFRQKTKPNVKPNFKLEP